MKQPILLLIPLLLLSACNKDKTTILAQCKAEVVTEGIAQEKEAAYWLKCMNKNGYKFIWKDASVACQDIPQNSFANTECYAPMSFMERLKEFAKRIL